MKIGQFSHMFRLAPETVRFYVNKGLLVPVSKHGRYLFSEQDVEDMELLLKLKRLNFSIAEIHRILSIKRLSNFDSADELDDYISILQKHKKGLVREKSRLESIIEEIDHEIHNTTGKHTGQIKKTSGVPLPFLAYLACPHCQKSFSLNGCNIEKDQIISGTLICCCGYKAHIQSGIIMGEPGDISIYDGPDMNRYCYRMMSPDLITLMKKNYQWLLDRLERCNVKNKVILEDYINDYCFCHANFELMDKDALYIICDKFPEIVAMYKNLIDRMNLDSQVLYIAAGSHLLPLKNGSVDVYIDLSTNEYAMFHQGFPMDALARYFNADSCALGSFWHFDGKYESVKEMHRQYPDAWGKNFDIHYFRDYLNYKWGNIINFEKLGTVTDSGEGDSFSYHLSGDKLNLTSYFVKKFRSNSVALQL